MFGPYIAKKDKTVTYKGNKIFPKIDNVHNIKVDPLEIENRINIFNKSYWKSIAKINHTINISTNKYFDEIGALFTLLPLTTRMISSPGAVYGKEAINYTTDTCPITLEWFDLDKKAFLSESSQIYLELSLLIKNIDKVYSIYNSFRKEGADSTHLSEFHHVEFEGKVNQKMNILILTKYYQRLLSDLLKYNHDDLSVFLSDESINDLEKETYKKIPIITLKDSLQLLYKETKEDKYKEFTLKYFHSWEETMLTQIVGGTLYVSEMPLLEVPFYHSIKPGIEPLVANNADLIGSGYREIVGCGQRIKSLSELEDKAKIFNLPIDDYSMYIDSRKFENFNVTSGFGMGWERFLHLILEMPHIHSASMFPRVHNTMKP